MGLLNLILKATVLVLDLRDTYDALDSPKIDEIGRNERQVLVRNAEDGTKQLTMRKRVGTTKRKAAVKSALTTVLVWNLFHKVEPICDRTIAWFVPFYDSLKTLLLIWMLFTRSYGASILVYRLLAPVVRPYEPIIDSIFGLSLSLLAWFATLLAPLTNHCSRLLQRVRALVGQAAQPQREPSMPVNAINKHPRRQVPGTSIREQAKKKPPPPSVPPASVKSSPSSAGSSLRHNGSRPQSRAGPTKTSRTLSEKASQNSLSATHRVLQELPVPRHDFESSAPAASTSTSALASTSDTAPPKGKLTSVKTEPAESSVAVPAAPLGPPPTPPTGLHNYAFIPGLTPQRSGPASLVSPTPRFPGGFAFSFAAPHVSGSNGAHAVPGQARLPATTLMAPLSISSLQPAAPASRSNLLGLPGSSASSISTHESVDSAQDDRIVPPPIGHAGIRKKPSSRSLNGKAAGGPGLNASRTAPTLNSKKRVRSDENLDGQEVSAGEAQSRSGSPRKRVKSVAGKGTTSRDAVHSATTEARTKTKANGTNGSSTATGKFSVQRKKAASKSTLQKSGTDKVKAASTGSDPSTKFDEAASSIDTPTSTTEKTKITATKRKATTAQMSTQRFLARKAPSSIKSRSQSAEAAEASEPPQRLTRSRTRQNLAE
ncbi:hypothetical protein PHSY_004534 [Pseudozyma hubeiensis SY62]|uniref:Uncharacterized protein n=1 Tax=Pseudozyma hubeiensis (strain SY62) TaxID=1305764 RepID=R9PFT9_PSEHS|nr:hypothetical protein PHSY_004534 [Pseudozyma hubeiensis SY62]GAC96950.1 hypothetical protein PHSY_004534 [Pseudozyma hubeiensis SY62]